MGVADDEGEGDFIGIEGVEGLAGLVEDVVCDVYDVVDGAEADGGEAVYEPWG